MWQNGTQNIYILIFMVPCICESFSSSHLLAFKAFLSRLLVPSNALLEEEPLLASSFGLEWKRGLWEGASLIFSFLVHIKFDLLCVLPITEKFSRQTLSQLFFLPSWVMWEENISNMNQFLTSWGLKKSLLFCVLWGIVLWCLSSLCLNILPHLSLSLTFSSF